MGKIENEPQHQQTPPNRIDAQQAVSHLLASQREGMRVKYKGVEYAIGNNDMGRFLIRRDPNLPGGGESVWPKNIQLAELEPTTSRWYNPKQPEEIENVTSGDCVFVHTSINERVGRKLHQVPSGFCFVDVQDDTITFRVPDVGPVPINTNTALKNILKVTDPDDPAKLMDTNDAFGWKLHLNFDPKNERVEDVVRTKLQPLLDNGEIKSAKIGNAGNQPGKEATIYCGSRDNAERIAKNLSRQMGTYIIPHETDRDDSSAETDIAFTMRGDQPLIMGRYNAAGDENFSPYGFKGICGLKTWVKNMREHSQKLSGPELEAAYENERQKADSYLRTIYRSHYTGTAQSA